MQLLFNSLHTQSLILSSLHLVANEESTSRDQSSPLKGLHLAANKESASCGQRHPWFEILSLSDALLPSPAPVVRQAGPPRCGLLNQHLGRVMVFNDLLATDKTSILGEAINYLKHLEQRAENLEEAKRSSKMAMESGVFVKKSQVFEEEEGSSLAGEIEVRVVNNNVLIRVHCGKHKGILANLLSQVESMNMVVVNTNVSLFGNSSLEITIIAEMEKGFSLSVKEVAMALRGAFKPATA
ncbi:Transcription factor bHLH19 [Striga hermonthica]|uniref:Transcription factor bHLH19 n=1 Tax=Striga hermonthica TaxID=68872 RepID=A0A9N7NYU4_STRHE|nr:Transcription factor bHLH19 [Striga hermonthica]